VVPARGDDAEAHALRILVQHEPGIGRDVAPPDRLPRKHVGLQRVVVGSAELVGMEVVERRRRW
jgi:hypothetical protein